MAPSSTGTLMEHPVEQPTKQPIKQPTTQATTPPMIPPTDQQALDRFLAENVKGVSVDAQAAHPRNWVCLWCYGQMAANGGARARVMALHEGIRAAGSVPVATMTPCRTQTGNLRR